MMVTREGGTRLSTGVCSMSTRLSRLLAVAAAASLVAVPLSAASLPTEAVPVSVYAHGVFDPHAVNADQWRRYRRDGIDAGDVIGTVVVLGTIAAIANAASRAGRYRTTRGHPYPYPGDDWRRDDRDYRYRPYEDRRSDDGRGIDRAVDMCAREIERDARIDTIDEAVRNGTGWRVAGRTRTGDSFTCMIGNDGRIEAVDFGRGLERRGAVNGAQWPDERYASARAAQDGAAPDDRSDAADDSRFEGGQTPGNPG